MKANFLFAALFILAIGMTGCSNSLDNENLGSGKDNNILIVKIPDNVKLTRSIETPVTSETQTGISDVTVFLLAGQSVERAEEFTTTDINAHYKRFEQVPAQVDRVIIVANRVGQNISSLSTADDIRNYAFTVASQHNGTELNGRTLMGEAVAENHTDPDAVNHAGHDYKQANVVLKAITARMEIGTVIPGEGVETVELVAVYINNFYATYPLNDLTFYSESNEIWKTTVDGTDPGANNGSATDIGTITPGPYTPEAYMTLGDAAEVKQSEDSKVYAFHVFPGNVPHLIMLVKVMLEDKYYETDDSGNALKYKYGYLTFNKYNTSEGYITEMLGHNVYRMGIGAKGIPVNAKDITDKPEKGPYDLGVDVEIAEWSFHEVTPEV